MLVGTNDQDPEQLRRALVELENPSLSEHKTVVFPEYANRNLRSLLFELRDVVPAEQRSEVGNAYDRSLVVTEFYIWEMQHKRYRINANDKPFEGIWEPSQRIDYLRDLSKALNLKRWNEPFSPRKPEK